MGLAVQEPIKITTDLDGIGLKAYPFIRQGGFNRFFPA